MYSILDDLYAEETDRVFTPNNPINLSLKKDIKELQTYDIVKQYNLKVEISTYFKAKKGRLEPAYEHAKRNIAMHIYGDFLDDINRIVSAVYSDDGEEVLSICKTIKNKVYNLNQ